MYAKGFARSTDLISISSPETLLSTNNLIVLLVDIIDNDIVIKLMLIFLLYYG